MGCYAGGAREMGRDMGEGERGNGMLCMVGGAGETGRYMGDGTTDMEWDVGTEATGRLNGKSDGYRIVYERRERKWDDEWKERRKWDCTWKEEEEMR